MVKNYRESVNWSYIPDHPSRILMIGGSGSDKTNMLLNLIKHQQPDGSKIYLNAKDQFELNYQLPINGREEVGIKQTKNPKAFIDYWQPIGDVYENLKDYNPTKGRKVLAVLDGMKTNKNLSPMVTELFLIGRKQLNALLVLVS